MRHLLLLLLTCIGPALWAYDAEVDGIYYDLIGTRLACVTYASLGLDAAGSYEGDVVIPEQITHNGRVYSVMSIGEGAFAGCDRLTSVSLPASIKAISACAFLGCSNLKTIMLPANKTLVVNSNAFACCQALKEITLPRFTEQLDTMLFYCCSSLEKIVLPHHVKQVREGALRHCNTLKDVYCFAEQVPETELDAFSQNSQNGCTLHVPAKAVETYRQHPLWNGFSQIVALTDNDYIEQNYQRADINDDGCVSPTDIVRIVRILQGEGSAEDIRWAADADANGEIDGRDVDNIVEKILNF